MALAAALCCCAAGAQAQTPAEEPERLPVELEADQLSGRPDLDAQAQGNVVLKRGPITIRSDRMTYDNVTDTAKASGSVRITREGDRFSGPELQLQLQRFEGYFLQPEYFFGVTQAGGRAERIDFIDPARAQLWGATYSSCGADGSSGTPPWLLSADHIKLDREANEGIAEGGVLRFYGVPILAAPKLSFPLSDERKSGWLPPSINLDSKAGFELGVPYYWNIAPNRDATLTPTVMTRRGVSLEGEFRYLEPSFKGTLAGHVLPDDRVAGRNRYALRFDHEGDAPEGIHYRLRGLRVSDDAYWKDFSSQAQSWTPRLLATDLRADRPFTWNGVDLTAYARVQQWQVLQQDDARILAPYQRSPQVGLRGGSALGGGFEWNFETEVNHFTRPTDGQLDALPTGTRFHAVAHLSRLWRAPGWWVVPKLSLNTAQYDIDDPTLGHRSASRTIPTLSVDAGMTFERETTLFGRELRQTLEPRLLYVNTPYRDQRDIPNFDAYGRDFNAVSVYSDSEFAGIDRVADANRLTAGVTTRLIDAQTGAERLRLGLAQRFLFRDQRIFANADGTPNFDADPAAAPSTQRVSDLLLFGTATFTPRWLLDAAVQYDPDSRRAVRSVLTGRYMPEPFHTLSAGYRLTRGLSEQLELGWQWPLYRREGVPQGPPTTTGACSGTLYGVGRLNYSLRDSRVTDSIVGLEYDAGCWIGRVVAERLSTGRSEATTRLLLQLELVGLSRLGSNPLKTLKDNVPGYRLLRDDRDTADAAAETAY